jgi:hypothetical protein
MKKKYKVKNKKKKKRRKTKMSRPRLLPKSSKPSYSSGFGKSNSQFQRSNQNRFNSPAERNSNEGLSAEGDKLCTYCNKELPPGLPHWHTVHKHCYGAMKKSKLSPEELDVLRGQNKQNSHNSGKPEDHVINFGKYKGIMLKQLWREDEFQDYLSWLETQDTFNSDGYRSDFRDAVQYFRTLSQ